jgi:hypothetical protein
MKPPPAPVISGHAEVGVLAPNAIGPIHVFPDEEGPPNEPLVRL